MAKKKKDDEVVEEEMTDLEASAKAAADLEKAFAKEYGEGIIIAGIDVKEEKSEILTMGPSLDIALGKGVPFGSWVSIVGPEKLGKTVTVLSACAEAQRMGHVVYYFDVECRLKPRDFEISGLQTTADKFKYIRSTKQRFLNNVDILTMAERILKTIPGCIVVFDSVSAMLSARVEGEALNKSDFGAGNQPVARFLDECTSVVRLNKSIVFGVIHQYANTSGYGKAFNEKVAKRWQYQADVKLVGKSSKGWRSGNEETGPEIGKIVTWEIGTSAIGAPGAKVESYIRYGVGLDRIYEKIQLASELGIIKSGGAWMTLKFLDKDDVVGTDFEKKFEEKGEVVIQGAQKVYESLEKYPNWSEKLTQKINEETGIV